MKTGLTREQWDDLRRRVYERDLQEGYERSRSTVSFAAWLAATPYGACVAWQLDPILWGTCVGRIEFDHVPERGETAMSMKADDDERHLQTTCGWHHGTQRTGGGVLTSERLRDAARDRLARLYDA